MIYYRGFAFEWISHRQDFRVFDPKHPEQTCAYEDSLQEGKKHIDELYALWENKERD